MAATGGRDLPIALLEDVIDRRRNSDSEVVLVTRTFDAIIIGAGQAGPSLAGRLTGAGMSVALIERKLIGGTCINTGCTPTKTLIASAYAAHLARRASDYGVTTGGPVGVDMKRVKARKNAVVGASRAGLEAWLKGMANCTVYEDHACFEAPNEIRVGEELLSASRIFINVGGRALVPNMPGLDEISYLTNASMLDLDVLPHHLVIVGGSYVGLEFAQMYRRFGSEVTVVEKGPRLIQHEDEDVSAAVKDILEAEGIHIVFVPNASVSHGVAQISRSRLIASLVIERSLVPIRCWRLAGARIPTISALTRPVSTSTSADSLWSTMSCAPVCPASGRSATATVKAPSPILPIMTSRSSQPIFSMTIAAAPATGFQPMRFMLTRRSAVLV